MMPMPGAVRDSMERAREERWRRRFYRATEAPVAWRNAAYYRFEDARKETRDAVRRLRGAKGKDGAGC